ncbi:hypothetical protein ACOSP7_018536 [Xanthoceras sorbifolium]
MQVNQIQQIDQVNEGLMKVGEVEGAKADDVAKGEGRVDLVVGNAAVVALVAQPIEDPTVEKIGRATMKDQVENEREKKDEELTP